MLNQCILLGTINSEITKREFSNGNSITRFRLRTHEVFNINGESVRRSTVHLIDVKGGRLQANLDGIIKPGEIIMLTGTIHNRLTKHKTGDKWITSIYVYDNDTFHVLSPTSGIAIELSENRTPAQKGSGPTTLRVNHERPTYEPVPPIEDEFGTAGF